MLANLVASIRQTLSEVNQDYLEILINVQQIAVRTNISAVQKHLEKVKGKLSSQLTEEQITNLLTWQKQVTRYEIEIEQVSGQEMLEAQIEVAPPAYQN